VQTATRSTEYLGQQLRNRACDNPTASTIGPSQGSAGFRPRIPWIASSKTWLGLPTSAVFSICEAWRSTGPGAATVQAIQRDKGGAGVDHSDDAGPTLVTRLLFLRRRPRGDIQRWDGSSRKLRYIGAWREESPRPGEAKDRKNARGGQHAHGSGYCSMKIQPYAAPKLVIKQAPLPAIYSRRRRCPPPARPQWVRAKPLWVVARTKSGPPNRRDVSTYNLARGRRSAVGCLFCSCRQCGIPGVYSLLASASARWR
jgi:hypothetical protein